MKNFLLQLDDRPTQARAVAGFDFPAYWAELGRLCDKVGFECNKVSLAWLSPPLPPAAQLTGLAAGLELACVSLLAAHHGFPADGGGLVRTDLSRTVRAVLEAALAFTRSLADTVGRKFPANSHPALHTFSALSERCEAVKRLPRGNKAACLVRLQDQQEMLRDALSELEQVGSAEFSDDFMDESEQWSETDHQIINPSKGLIKTSIVLIKKASMTMERAGQEDSAEQLAEYDTALACLDRLSATVDDLALTLYPPLDWTECKQANETLKNYLEQSLQSLGSQHFMQSEEANKWREFIRKAILHNFSEIQRVFITRGLAEIRVSEVSEESEVS